MIDSSGSGYLFESKMPANFVPVFLIPVISIISQDIFSMKEKLGCWLVRSCICFLLKNFTILAGSIKKFNSLFGCMLPEVVFFYLG